MAVEWCRSVTRKWGPEVRDGVQRSHCEGASQQERESEKADGGGPGHGSHGSGGHCCSFTLPVCGSWPWASASHARCSSLQPCLCGDLPLSKRRCLTATASHLARTGSHGYHREVNGSHGYHREVNGSRGYHGEVWTGSGRHSRGAQSSETVCLRYAI